VAVFISYRRADAAGTAGRIADRLKVQLDADVFIDESLEPGDAWREELVGRVRAAEVVLVIIGPRFAARALERSRTLGDDTVRLEVEEAYAANRTVIPVLVEGAQLPSPDELPHGLRPLRGRHVHTVRMGSDWERDVQELAAFIATRPPPEPLPPAPTVRRVTGGDPTFERVARGVATGRVVIVLGPQFNGGDGTPEAVPDAPALARRLAGVFGVQGDVEDLAWVSQQIDATEGRPELLLELETALDARAPCSIHHSVARLAQRLRDTRGLGHLIVTANYDTALEQAFDALGVPYDLAVFVVSEGGLGRFLHVRWEGTGDERCRLVADPTEYADFPVAVTNQLQRTIIVKLQGSASVGGLPESYVVTEDDHLLHLSRTDHVPRQILGKMAQSPFVLLGYPLRDWTVRGFLQRVWKTKMARSAVVSRPIDTAERNLWGRIDVDVIEDDPGAFAERLVGRVHDLTGP
jgi:hypothetical protein